MNIRLRAASDTASAPATFCWRHASPPAWGWWRAWRATQLQAARRRAHLACCIPSRGLPSPRNHIGIAEDALLEVRWHHDLRGVERESVRGDARRHGECDLAHRERQLSRDEHHLKGATTAACTCRRSQRVALKCNRQKPAKLSCAARFGRMSLPWITQSGPCILLAHVESVGLVLQAG